MSERVWPSFSKEVRGVVSEGEEVGNLWRRAGGMVFFCFGCCFLEEEEGEGDVFLLVGFVVRFLFGWLIGWLFFLGVLLKGGTFLVSTFSYHAGCGYTFFFFLFLFFSLFFLVELEGGVVGLCISGSCRLIDT